MQYREAADLLGLTLREMVALHGRVRSASLSRLQGYNGSWSHAAASFGNMFYVTLLAETWQQVTIGGVLQYKANGKDMYSPIITVLSLPSCAVDFLTLTCPTLSFLCSYMAPADLNLLWMPDLLAAAQEFAVDASAHAVTFHSAWSKVRQSLA